MTHIAKTRDPVEVLAIFSTSGARPFSFKWSGRKFIVEKINLTYSQSSGNGRLVYFSVTAEGNYFKLAFETNEMKWFIEEVVSE
jgi:hypothetical protein